MLSTKKRPSRDVVRARQAGLDATTVQEQAKAENMISSALRQLFALSEAYPQLRASENFTQVQEQISSTENKIAFSRQHYNDTVRRYNTGLETFPNNLVAGMFGFSARDFFEVELADEREVPKVQF